MVKLDQRGSLLIPLVLMGLLFVFALGFGTWAFMGRQEYKNNVDAKIAEAIEANTEKVGIDKEAEFAEREKSPNKTYQGPSSSGSLSIVYPKNWSAYILENGSGSTVLDGYIHPNFVPDTKSDISFALRFEILDNEYDEIVKRYETKVKSGKLTFVPYRAPKVDDALGGVFTGEIDTKKTGTLVLLPVRDKTILIWTEGQEYKADFDRMLEQLTFNQ